jgi:hypothetical protein
LGLFDRRARQKRWGVDADGRLRWMAKEHVVGSNRNEHVLGDARRIESCAGTITLIPSCQTFKAAARTSISSVKKAVFCCNAGVAGKDMRKCLYCKINVLSLIGARINGRTRSARAVATASRQASEGRRQWPSLSDAI